MTLTDPIRPTIYGRPAYQAYGRLLALPGLYIWPKSNNLSSIGAVLGISSTESAWKECLWDTRQIPQILEEYRADPEATFLKLFNYNPPAKLSEPTVRPTLASMGVLSK